MYTFRLLYSSVILYIKYTFLTFESNLSLIKTCIVNLNKLHVFALSSGNMYKHQIFYLTNYVQYLEFSL